MPTTNEIRKHTKEAALILCVTFLSLAALAQTAPVAAAEKRHAVRQIVVSIPDRKLALIEDGAVKKVFPVAVGKQSTPSPTGSFRIVNRVANPTYYHSGKIVPSGPANPVGTRWMGLSEHGYGIHGTNAPGSIGKAASHGCIRMARNDLEELFGLVEVGDAVEIRAERDEQTARLFGPDQPGTTDTPATHDNLLAEAAPAAQSAGQ
jgi:lipoprotein-anchoring transpeptidase ErfK/SrfK